MVIPTDCQCQQFHGPSVGSTILTKGRLEPAEHGRLVVDHDRLTSCLHLAKTALRDGRVGESNAFFTRFRELLEHHMRSEENILFPRLAAMSEPIHRELLDVLASEHDVLRPWVSAVQAGLDDGTASVEGIEELLHGLIAHEAKEEMYLYPIFSRLADPDGLTRVYRNHRPKAASS